MKKLFFIATIIFSLAFVFTACSGNNDKAKTGQLANDEMYTCTMHNEVMSNHPAECPKCGMKLVKQKMTPEQQKMMNERMYIKPKD
jgi:hypothetical protein